MGQDLAADPEASRGRPRTSLNRVATTNGVPDFRETWWHGIDAIDREFAVPLRESDDPAQ
jgi:hypothetical protein